MKTQATPVQLDKLKYSLSTFYDQLMIRQLPLLC
jgi:hypothetical protein